MKFIKRLFCKHIYRSKGSRIFKQGTTYTKLRIVECDLCGKRKSIPWLPWDYTENNIIK